jgi:hypothetical protein
MLIKRSSYNYRIYSNKASLGIILGFIKPWEKGVVQIAKGIWQLVKIRD